MGFEKLPVANNTDKKIYDMNFFENRAELRAEKDYILGVEKISIWFDAFRDYYNNEVGKYHDYKKESGPQMEDALIGEYGKTPVIGFRVDWSHCALKFFYDAEDSLSKRLIEGFLEKLI